MTTIDYGSSALTDRVDRPAGPGIGRSLLGGAGVLVVCVASVAFTLVSPVLALVAPVLDGGRRRS
jgi:hypothetical protein